MTWKSAGRAPASDNPQGTLFLWPDHWQVVGRLMPNRPHRHISASLLVGLDQTFQLKVDGHWRRTRAAIVSPDVIQALDPGSTSMWIAQMDPDSRHWRSLCHLVGDSGSADLNLDHLEMPSVQEPACEAVERCLEGLLTNTGRPAEPLDERVSQVCEILRRELPEKLDVSLLAGYVGLSSSRLSHLFRQQTGVPLRRFLLHLKMNRALAFWEPGISVSRLATEAGFYDQPHLVRTARDMFDALPSEYVTAGWFRVCRCPSP
ncbi:AraC family transcriptional regulator [uncultured Marinobacter sp.]|uniref:helix-turn-helix domain-containing protein n=1 Tax=uncultured Marinobacter sp. TaxID=187379 RepID=UPI00263342C5|nr:AraC family transcriptional regulator [uncultured Marinobacter sp.]